MHILTHGRQNLAPRLAYHGVVVKHTEAASYPGLVEDLIPVRGKLRGFGTASTNHLLTPTLTSLNYPINLNYVETTHWNMEKRIFKNLARPLNTLQFVEFTSSIYLNTDGLFLKYLVKNSPLASLKTGHNMT